MCLAIPGKILEVVSEPDCGALVDVVGVRRRVNLGLIEEENPSLAIGCLFMLASR